MKELGLVARLKCCGYTFNTKSFICVSGFGMEYRDLEHLSAVEKRLSDNLILKTIIIQSFFLMHNALKCFVESLLHRCLFSLQCVVQLRSSTLDSCAITGLALGAEASIGKTDFVNHSGSQSYMCPYLLSIL